MPEDKQTPAGTAEDTQPEGAPDQPNMSEAQIASYFKSRADSAKRERKSRYPEWRRNVELRIGHIATLYTGGVALPDDEIQTEINPDWSLTKTKTANLFSQVPAIRLAHENTAYRPALPHFAKALNYEIGPKRANLGPAMEEVLNDIVNAAGVGGIYTGYAARFEDKLLPVLDKQLMGLIPPDIAGRLTEVEVPEDFQANPEAIASMLRNLQMPVKRTPQVVSDKIFSRRVSPIDLLYPSEFTGSDFNEADFMGYTGRCSWPEAKLEFKLSDEDYSKVITNDPDAPETSLRANPERAALAEAKRVKFDDLYYWRYRVDPNEKSFHAIWRIVFVEGMDKPVIHEPWKGQRLDPDTGQYLGNRRFPIQVCTLTYITDNPIPPSDSSAGRPQVNDMRRSRRDMFNNRARSVPIRWFDVNRIDQTIQTMLMNGTWQGMIPTNGDGSRAIGEIARASYPGENLTFDQTAKMDLMDSWQIGPGQNSGTQAPGEGTATAAQIVQQNFATRIGQERNRVADFFLRVCENIAGYMVLYSDFPILTDQERQQMFQAWDHTRIMADLVFKILPDSQIVLDSNARIQKLMNFLNMTVQSGFVNPKPIIVEIAELTGIDPNLVVVDPQPKEEEPNISYRFSSKDDITNAVVMALLVEKKQAPTLEAIEQAKKLLAAAAAPVPAPGAGAEGIPQPPAGPEGPGAPPPAPGPAGPTPVPEGGLDAHPDWHLASKVAQRSRDIQG